MLRRFSYRIGTDHRSVHLPETREHFCCITNLLKSIHVFATRDVYCTWFLAVSDSFVQGLMEKVTLALKTWIWESLWEPQNNIALNSLWYAFIRIPFSCPSRGKPNQVQPFADKIVELLWIHGVDDDELKESCFSWCDYFNPPPQAIVSHFDSILLCLEIHHLWSKLRQWRRDEDVREMGWIWRVKWRYVILYVWKTGIK
jgi:hypothetical protein